MSPSPQPPVMPSSSPAAGPGEGDMLGDLETRQWMLIRYVGQPLGESIPLPPGGLNIGREADNGLCLPEPEVSRHHARLQVSADLEAVELRDLESTNGVFVNGRRVLAHPRPHRLGAEDVLRVGGHAFKVKHMDAMERRYHQALVSQSTLDALTGVGNRATLLHLLEIQVGLARRHRRPLSVILADLDRFKAINGAHGHREGDRALEAFGTLLRHRLRGSDYVGRLGGDEFLVVLPETALVPALKAAEDIRRACEAQPLQLASGLGLRLTCSLGVTELKHGDSDGGSLLARADAALFGAKAAGRNRISSAP